MSDFTDECKEAAFAVLAEGGVEFCGTLMVATAGSVPAGGMLVGKRRRCRHPGHSEYWKAWVYPNHCGFSVQ